jgi:hypothetical protein
MATSGYSAGIESNNVVLSYVPEATYGTMPAATAAKTLRFTSESLSSNKTRQRAPEIDATRQAADMVTTQFQAGGNINGALSIGTYDDLFASCFASAWATDVLTNGNTFQSLYLQKQLASNLWLRYPGAFISGFSLNAAQGGFVSCVFNVLAQNETSGTADAATGTATAAGLGGKIINTVSMTGGITLGGAGLTKVLELSLDVNNEGAAQNFAIGSTAAAGMLPGVFTVGGRVRQYFSDFTLYTRYINETEGAVSITFSDGTTSYIVALLNSVVMNPVIVAGGVGQAVVAEYAIEGRKDSVTGKTLRITRDLV